MATDLLNAVVINLSMNWWISSMTKLGKELYYETILMRSVGCPETLAELPMNSNLTRLMWVYRLEHAHILCINTEFEFLVNVIDGTFNIYENHCHCLVHFYLKVDCFRIIIVTHRCSFAWKPWKTHIRDGVMWGSMFLRRVALFIVVMPDTISCLVFLQNKLI